MKRGPEYKKIMNESYREGLSRNVPASARILRETNE